MRLPYRPERILDEALGGRGPGKEDCTYLLGFQPESLEAATTVAVADTTSRKRFHLHFIPTSSSWLNLIERWFREITDKRIRRGAFKSVPALIDAILEFIETHNDDPKPFVWSAPVDRILSKIAKCKEALGTLH